MYGFNFFVFNVSKTRRFFGVFNGHFLFENENYELNGFYKKITYWFYLSESIEKSRFC